MGRLGREGWLVYLKYTALHQHQKPIFLSPAENYRRPSAGMNPKAAFMEKTGFLTSKRLSTAWVTPSNIQDDILTGLRPLITGPFPTREQRLSSLREQVNLVIRNNRNSTSAMQVYL